MNHAADDVAPWMANVAVCNGEGEQSFMDFLVQAQAERFDPERIRGISYARDGEWHHTEKLPRFRDLSAIPSPWLEGAFEQEGTFELAVSA